MLLQPTSLLGPNGAHPLSPRPEAPIGPLLNAEGRTRTERLPAGPTLSRASSGRVATFRHLEAPWGPLLD